MKKIAAVEPHQRFRGTQSWNTPEKFWLEIFGNI
jgi:hypothetical protein